MHERPAAGGALKVTTGQEVTLSIPPATPAGRAAAYAAGPIRRKRSTKAEMIDRYQALVEIVTDAAPTGVRFCYYRAVSQGIVQKTDNGYGQVPVTSHLDQHAL